MVQRLYNTGYERTERLGALTRRLEDEEGPAAATQRDIVELWQTYVDGCGDVGTPASVVEFGAWLVGNQWFDVLNWYTDIEPASVVW
jgi:hypothetical protein